MGAEHRHEPIALAFHSGGIGRISAQLAVVGPVGFLQLLLDGRSMTGGDAPRQVINSMYPQSEILLETWFGVVKILSRRREVRGGLSGFPQIGGGTGEAVHSMRKA
jgi:hypothetical protein